MIHMIMGLKQREGKESSQRRTLNCDEQELSPNRLAVN